MTTQLTFEEATIERDRILEQIVTAPRTFQERAKQFILAHLEANGPTSGEDLTDTCKASGIAPKDDRHFGPVYASLARSGAIQRAGTCQRSKGHNTAGGIVWRLS